MRVFVPILLLIFSGCTVTNQRSPHAPPSNLVVNGKIFTTTFQQRAAEYRALCLQAFNIAYLRLDEALAKSAVRPRAIITDVDETVLDNSSYAAKRALEGKDYEAGSWTDYINLAVSDSVPGALAFLRYAKSQGVEVFYITNREQRERAGTLRNLQKLGFPDADSAHLFTKVNTSGKEPRRQQVASTHEVILLLGDNLSDFSAVFDKKSADARMSSVNALAPEFGQRFIVLPNPVYGDWELALYQYNYTLTPAQKDSILKASLKPY